MTNTIQMPLKCSSVFIQGIVGKDVFFYSIEKIFLHISPKWEKKSNAETLNISLKTIASDQVSTVTRKTSARIITALRLLREQSGRVGADSDGSTRIHTSSCWVPVEFLLSSCCSFPPQRVQRSLGECCRTMTSKLLRRHVDCETVQEGVDNRSGPETKCVEVHTERTGIDIYVK